jgi:hypothetical protein
MNNLLNNPEVVAAVVAAIGGIATVIKVGLSRILKKVESMLEELRPNGGNSMKDQINRLDHRIDEIYKILLNKGE